MIHHLWEFSQRVRVRCATGVGRPTRQPYLFCLHLNPLMSAVNIIFPLCVFLLSLVHFIRIKP